MPMTTNKITVELDSDLSFASDSISVTHKLNDIPTAQISFIPRTAEEVDQLSSFDETLFSEVGITVKVNDDGPLIFRGSFGGSQSSSSASQVALSALYYGGLYKLSQMSVATPGFHPVGSANLNNMVIAGLGQKESLLADLSDISASNDLIETFKITCLNILAKVDAIISSGVTVGSDRGSVSESMRALYKFQADKASEVIVSEIDKIDTIQIDASVYELIRNQKLKQIVSSYATSGGTTFWSFLVGLCEAYQLNIGTFGDKIYAFPHSPVGEPSINITTSDIQAVNVSPFPLHLPTRCYFSVRSRVGAVLGKSGEGMFPKLGDASKPTKLEERLGTVNALYYNVPGWALHGKQFISGSGTAAGGVTNDEEQEKALGDLYDKFAQAYLVKETLKHRTASLVLKLVTNIPVGSVIRFVDPFFGKTYQGFVIQTTQSISSGSVSTVIDLQYVVADSEKEFLGLEADGYTENPLYPSYSSSDLTSLLGL